MQTEQRNPLSDSGVTTLYTQEPKKRKPLSDSGVTTLYTQEPKIKAVSSVSTEANIKTPSLKEMTNASQKIKAAAKSKLNSNEYKEFIPEYRAVKVLEPVLKQARVRTIYNKKLNAKEESKFKQLENKTTYIENVLKQVGEKHKQNEINKMIEKSTRNNAATNLQKVIRGHQERKDIRNEILKQASEKQKQNREKIGSTLVGNVIQKSLGKITQVNEEIKPVELFGGTRSGAAIHPEPTAPPQPLFGKNLKVTMKNNYDEIKKLFDIEPKSYQDVLDAKKKINTYKQNINRIKIRKNAKSIYQRKK